METDVLVEAVQGAARRVGENVRAQHAGFDGVWFQSVERELGMDRAMRHDERCGKPSPKRRHGASKDSWQLPDRPGLDGLERALSLRFAGIRQPAGRTDTGKRFPDIPCGRLPGTVCTQAKRDAVASVSVRRNPRIRIFRQNDRRSHSMRTVSCFPRVSDPGCACSWRFTMGNPGNGQEEAPDDNGQGKV